MIGVILPTIYYSNGIFWRMMKTRLESIHRLLVTTSSLALLVLSIPISIAKDVVVWVWVNQWVFQWRKNDWIKLTHTKRWNVHAFNTLFTIVRYFKKKIAIVRAFFTSHRIIPSEMLLGTRWVKWMWVFIVLKCYTLNGTPIIEWFMNSVEPCFHRLVNIHGESTNFR